MTQCKFDVSWVGRCRSEAVDGSDYCEKHHGQKCTSCKTAQATHDCDHTGQFVCGYPLCENCIGWSDTSKPSGVWGFMNHSHVSKQWLAQRGES